MGKTEAQQQRRVLAILSVVGVAVVGAPVGVSAVVKQARAGDRTFPTRWEVSYGTTERRRCCNTVRRAGAPAHTGWTSDRPMLLVSRLSMTLLVDVKYKQPVGLSHASLLRKQREISFLRVRPLAAGNFLGGTGR